MHMKNSLPISVLLYLVLTCPVLAQEQEADGQFQPDTSSLDSAYGYQVQQNNDIHEGNIDQAIIDSQQRGYALQDAQDNGADVQPQIDQNWHDKQNLVWGQYNDGLGNDQSAQDHYNDAINQQAQ